MNFTLEQQEHYIDTCVNRYNDGKLTKEQAITRIANMGELVPQLRNYAIEQIQNLGLLEETDQTMLDYTHN